jgi:hypothetical protein
MMKKIVIVLEGGLVQNVVSEEPIDVIVVDYDVDTDDDDAMNFFGNKAVIRSFHSEENPSEIERVIEEIE